MSRALDSASVSALVFSGGEVWSEDGPNAQASEVLHTLAESVAGPSAEANEANRSIEDQSVSTYVRVFEDMISTVIKEEKHLLNDEEFALLTVFAHLSYNARFLMVKLLLRKQETWHRLDTLKYESELGSVAAIVTAIDELCCVNPDTSEITKKEEQNVIDLTVDQGVTNLQQEQDPRSSVDVPCFEPLDNRPFALARSEQEMDLKSLLECLRLDELRAVAKQLKLKINQKKDDLIKDLLDASSSQSTLSSFACRDGVKQFKGHAHRQTKLSFFKLESQKDRLREIVLSHIVRCVQVDEEFFGVIHRVNLVYFRITQYTSGILVAALLTRFGKRAYPGYEYERTKNVWPSRQALLDYEEMLVLEGRVDSLLAGGVPALDGRASLSKTPVARFLSAPITPGNAHHSGGREDIGDEDMPDVKPDSVRIRGARMVKDIFERIYPYWQDLVRTKGGEDGRAGGLERFHHGHVLTRIVCKSSAALGTLGEHERELEILEALLAQKRWRRGQRGRWYERRALILSNHFPKDEETMERTLDAVIEALKDPDTHLVCRPKLQRRLKRLENKLKIPVQERHTSDGVLADADEVMFEAIRLRHRAASLSLDRMGRRVDPIHQRNQNIKHYYSPLPSMKHEPSSDVAPPLGHKPLLDISKGKSLWLGCNGEELTVESLALQRYEEQGFKGVHCETRVISMLFGLLFWDIIFASIPGAFETPYQTTPLDIAEDSFYHARKDLMEQRLAAIEAGKGIDIVRDVDGKHRASGTWCVGVQWDMFSSEDLVDIVMCIGGKALSIICRVLCEDYRFGTSGGPDLFLWNTEKGACKFVEVKSPGDTLQENQRVWINILLKAPVAVEICRIVESGDEADKKPHVRTPKSTRTRAKRAPRNRGTLANTEDADALPSILDNLHTTQEEQEEQPSGAHSLPGPSSDACVFPSAIDPSACTEGTSPLKRKASPPGIMPPTPSKRQKT